MAGLKAERIARVRGNVIIIALKTLNYPQSVTVILPKTCGVNVSQLLADIREMLLYCVCLYILLRVYKKSLNSDVTSTSI